MKLPCAVHPCNHALVQELSLYASLSQSRTTVSFRKKEREINDLYSAAQTIARSRCACAELAAYHQERKSLRIGEVPLMVVRHRLQQQQQSAARRGGHRQTLGKLLALYAPHARLPRLPAHWHNDVSHAEALQHEALLAGLLRPLGLRVSLSGAWRRGAPQGRAVDLVVALTREATEEILAAGDAAPRGGAAARQSRQPHIQRDSLTIPARAGRVSPLFSTQTELISQRVAFAPVDEVPSGVLHRYHRALQTLENSGYLTAGAALPNAAAVASRVPHVCSLRLDPQRPDTPPPFHTSNPEVLRRLRLHHARLRFCPWQCFHVRRFFLTGPPAFTSHVTLKGLEQGMELNMNGIMSRVPSGNSAGHGAGGLDPQCVRHLPQSEQEVFALCHMPYIDPINRGIFCEERGL